MQKAMVVAASSGDAASRMTIFASMNVASALVITVLQILATVSFCCPQRPQRRKPSLNVENRLGYML